MDVYEDIEKAKKVINYSKFTHMGYNLIYPFTTENLNGYMNKLDFKNKKVLTDEMATFIVLNTASIQIIPTTVIAIRNSLGSNSPTAIIVPVWIATICAAIAGITATKIFIKLGK